MYCVHNTSCKLTVLCAVQEHQCLGRLAVRVLGSGSETIVSNCKGEWKTRRGKKKPNREEKYQIAGITPRRVTIYDQGKRRVAVATSHERRGRRGSSVWHTFKAPNRKPQVLVDAGCQCSSRHARALRRCAQALHSFARTLVLPGKFSSDQNVRCVCV